MTAFPDFIKLTKQRKVFTLSSDNTITQTGILTQTQYFGKIGDQSGISDDAEILEINIGEKKAVREPEPTHEPSNELVEPPQLEPKPKPRVRKAPEKLEQEQVKKRKVAKDDEDEEYEDGGEHGTSDENHWTFGLKKFNLIHADDIKVYKDYRFDSLHATRIYKYDGRWYIGLKEFKVLTGHKLGIKDVVHGHDQNYLLKNNLVLRYKSGEGFVGGTSYLFCIEILASRIPAGKSDVIHIIEEMNKMMYDT